MYAQIPISVSGTAFTLKLAAGSQGEEIVETPTSWLINCVSKIVPS